MRRPNVLVPVAFLSALSLAPACGGGDDDASPSSAGGTGAGAGAASTGGAGAAGTGTAGKGTAGTGTAGSGTAGTGTAGSGTAGTATAGSGTAGNGTAGSPSGTPGCGKPTSDPGKTWLPRSVSVGGTTRDYFVYLPGNYDPKKAYPIVYQFHGCSSSTNKEANNVPVEKQSGDAAILVRGRAAKDCWDTGKTSPDIEFFDAMKAAVEDAHCVDATRRFAAGYSSGSFMTHLLACVRGAELRGVATIAGGQTGATCTGKPAALLIHDVDDKTVPIANSEKTRDAYLKAYTCDAATTPFDPAPCRAYTGCDAGSPVVWCQTTGKDHDRQDALAAPAFWTFLSGL